MKKLIIILFIILFSTTLSYAGEVTLSWDANSEDTLAGYTLYIGRTSGDFTLDSVIINLADLQDANNPQYTWNIDSTGIFYFALDAFDTYGLHSDLADKTDTGEDVVATIRPQKPVSLQIQ